MEKKIDSVSIEIKQATFLILRLLPNKVWNILAEYVDNSLSSDRIERKQKSIVGRPVLQVNIDITDKFIKIRDNAGGINSTEFERALELANLPKNKTEFNEFGMGMKTSSIWLGDIWTIKSAAINETVERTVEFDLNKVVDNDIKSLKVSAVKKAKNIHFTEIIIKNLSENAPSSHQFDKIRDHLSSIYRIPIRTGEIEIIFNDKTLQYEDQKILKAPSFKSPNGIPVEWKYLIDFPLGKYRIKGFIGILDKMSNSLSGLSLFKKGRVIQGSHDEKYKPSILFGSDSGSALYKGLFGELELTGFDVTYNKGAFRDVDSLNRVMIEIKKILSNSKKDFIAQAINYSRKLSKQSIEAAAKASAKNIEKARKQIPINDKLKAIEQSNTEKAKTKANREQFRNAKSIIPELAGEIIEFGGKKVNLKMFLINSPNVDDLFQIFDEGTKKGVNEIHYKINLAHPFFRKHTNILKNKYEPIIDLIEAFVIAEINTSTVVTFGDKIRDTFNNYLKNIN
jgi:hypothetical protein